MTLFKDRRNPAAAKLRAYVDGIKQAEATTDEEWLEQWVAHCDADSIYIPRSTWIAILQKWAMKEAELLFQKDAA